MPALLKKTVELRKTSHCVIVRDTMAHESTAAELAPLEAVILSLCNGSSDAPAIAKLLPKQVTKAISGTVEEYVKKVLEQNKAYLDFCEMPENHAYRYQPSDFLFIPKDYSDTGRSVSPVSATLLITYRCNFHCIYCYNNSGSVQHEKLCTQDWLEAIHQLHSETECQSILLGGGEPLIHPGFFEILEAGRKAGMLMDFTTNGSLIDDDAVRRFADLGIGYVRVSLDSPYAGMHHQLTQTKDTFRKVTHAIEAMAKAGIHVGMKGILYDGNCQDAAELTRFAHDLGATDVMLDAYNSTGIGRGKKEMTLSEENYQAVKGGEAKFAYTTRNSQHERCGEQDILSCSAWKNSLIMIPDGTFPFCETLAGDPYCKLQTGMLI